MKKKNIFTGMLALAAAAVAIPSHAAVVNTVTYDGITFEVDSIATNEGSGAQKYDIYDINVTGLTGAGAASGPNGQGVISIGGTFAVTGTGSATNALLTPGKTATWANGTTLNGSTASSAANPGAGDNYTGNSYVNLDTVTGTSRAGQASTTSQNNAMWSSSWTGSYTNLNTPNYIGPSTFNGGPAGGGPDTPFLAELIVTHGSNWTFNGQVGTADTTVHSGIVLNNTQSTGSATTASISLTSAGNKSAAGTVVVAGSNGNYHVTSVDNISPGVGSGSIAISDIGNEAGTFIAGINVSGVSDLSALASALQTNSPGWTVSVVNGAITGLPGTWSLKATTSNPTGAGANDFLNIDLNGAGTITSVAAVPEPTSLGLLGLGSVLAASRRRRKA